jgi:hypothetical protein
LDPQTSCKQSFVTLVAETSVSSKLARTAAFSTRGLCSFHFFLELSLHHFSFCTIFFGWASFRLVDFGGSTVIVIGHASH